MARARPYVAADGCACSPLCSRGTGGHPHSSVAVCFHLARTERARIGLCRERRALGSQHRVGTDAGFAAASAHGAACQAWTSQVLMGMSLRPPAPRVECCHGCRRAGSWGPAAAPSTVLRARRMRRTRTGIPGSLSWLEDACKIVISTSSCLVRLSARSPARIASPAVAASTSTAAGSTFAAGDCSGFRPEPLVARNQQVVGAAPDAGH